MSTFVVIGCALFAVACLLGDFADDEARRHLELVEQSVDLGAQARRMAVLAGAILVVVVIVLLGRQP